MSRSTTDYAIVSTRWVDACASILLVSTSLLFFITTGHGMSFIGSFIISTSLQQATSILFTPWGLHLWIATVLLASSLLPWKLRLSVRCAAILSSLLVISWYYLITQWKIALVVTAIPTMFVNFCLAVITITDFKSSHK